MNRNRKQETGLRHQVFERDSYTCVLCSRPATDIHHLVSRAHGGLNAPTNLVSLCRIHHDLVHGRQWIGVELAVDDAIQAVTEYVHDYYAAYFEQWGGW